MELKQYEIEIHRLYEDFIKLHQQAGGNLPKALPGFPRSYYLDLIIDVTDTPDNIQRDIEQFKSKVLDTRGELFRHYEKQGITAVADFPHRSDGRKSKEPPEKILEKVRNAFLAYQHQHEHKIKIAELLGFVENTHISEQEAKSAERKVRRYLEYAETLLRSVDTCTFFEAVKTPFPRNK